MAPIAVLGHFMRAVALHGLGARIDLRLLARLAATATTDLESRLLDRSSKKHARRAENMFRDCSSHFHHESYRESVLYRQPLLTRTSRWAILASR